MSWTPRRPDPATLAARAGLSDRAAAGLAAAAPAPGPGVTLIWGLAGALLGAVIAAAVIAAWSLLTGPGGFAARPALAVPGLALFTGGLALARTARPAGIRPHLATGLAFAGLILTVSGLAEFYWEMDGMWLSAGVTLALAGLALGLRAPPNLQFLTMLVGAGLLVLAWMEGTETPAAMAALTALIAWPATAALIVPPPRRDPRPPAAALLTVATILAFGLALDPRRGSDGWSLAPLAVVQIAIFAAIARESGDGARARTPAILAGLVALAAGLALGPDTQMALAAIGLGWLMASPGLAVLGLVLQLGALARLYHSLHLSLLENAALLACVGAVLAALGGGLTLWRRRGHGAPPDSAAPDFAASPSTTAPATGGGAP